MAIGVYFHPQGMTKAQYEETLHKLTEAGAGTPPGRKYHACFGPDGQLMVFDIWDSVEEFQAFGETLMPILAEVGIQGGPPAILPVQNFIAN